MKKYTTLYILILALYSSSLTGQTTYSIVADNTIGCDSLEVSFSISPNTGITSANWDFGNGQTSSEIAPNAKYASVGSYSVSVVINGSEPVTTNNLITVYDTPNAQFTHKDTLGYYSIYFECQPQPQDVDYLYSWDFGDNETFFHDSLISVHRYRADGEYEVTLLVSNDGGCIASFSDTVIIETPDTLHVKKAFSPNNDGKNDFFIVETDGITVYSMTIFTRSGALVYKTESPFLSWDGTNTSGVEVSEGIYFYLIEQISGNSNHNQVGYVYLFR